MSEQENRKQKPSLEQLIESMQHQMQQMSARIEDLSRENRNLEEAKNRAEGRLRFLDSSTIADEARKRIECSRQASRNRGKYSYYCIRPDYALAIGPFHCDETDMDVVEAKFLKFYRIHFPAGYRYEIITEREYQRRTTKETAA